MLRSARNDGGNAAPRKDGVSPPIAKTLAPPCHHLATGRDCKRIMKTALVLAATLLLAACQVYAGGGTLVSDGRTTTVRQNSIEAGTQTGVRSRSSQVVVQPRAGDAY